MASITNNTTLSRKDHVWALPLLRTIVAMGGQGIPKNIIERIKADYQSQLSEQTWEWVIATNRIKWTRQALVDAGFLEKTKGVWAISEDGRAWLDTRSLDAVDLSNEKPTAAWLIKRSGNMGDADLEDDDLNDGVVSSPQNLILFGPPGTGKTYQVKERALSWVGFDCDEMSREQINLEFSRLLSAERIEFITFHQSYSYEDFIEGIRPVIVDGQVVYRVQDGVFKRIAKRAQAALEGGFDARWNKLLLQGEREIHSKGKKLYRLRPEPSDDSVRVIDTPEKTYRLSRMQMREVWERHQGMEAAALDVTDENFGSNSSYKWMVNRALSELSMPTEDDPPQQYVLIIDEINRGNISKIFGELITLLEPDKRLGGGDDELTVRLPLSGERFGVPQNLHVIGTMNTADRSIALLDIALRRRFKFIEVMPDVDVLLGELTMSEHAELIGKVFINLNERIIELYDRDHQLGHALFMKVVDLDDLKGVMLDSAIPLLREYFYGEPEKIVRIFGKSEIFIETRRVKVNEYGEERALFDVSPKFLCAEGKDLIGFFEKI